MNKHIPKIFSILSSSMFFLSSFAIPSIAAPNKQEYKSYDDDKSIDKQIDEINDKYNDMDDYRIPGMNDKNLERKIRNEMRKILRREKNLCDMIKEVDKLIKVLKFIRSEYNSKKVDMLIEMLTKFRAKLVEMDTTGKCQDEVKPVNETKIETLVSNNEVLSANLSFPMPNFIAVQKIVNGKMMEFTQIIHSNNLEFRAGEKGMPEIPVYRTLIGYPDGAEMQVSVLNKANQLSTQLTLLPYQEQALDQAAPNDPTIPDPKTFDDPPFYFDTKLYQTNRMFPGFDCRTTKIGKVRDLNVAQLECATGNYNPATRQLNLYSNIQFEVKYLGGNKGFVPVRPAESIENNLLAYEGIMNYGAITQYPYQWGNFPLLCYGEQYLILTHNNFLSAANRLATWKNQKGINTRVVVVNDGTGPQPDTNTQIDQYIEDQYNNCIVRPSYVLLLGDAEFIPTFYTSTSGSATTGSDNKYSMIGTSDNLPDIAVGRMPVDTLAQADTMVDKTINYEKTPPTLSSFYSNAEIASQFQCCDTGAGKVGYDQRTFIQVSEFSRNNLMSAGKTVDRIYTKTNDGAYTGDTTPRRYNDGTLLPADLGAGSGFAWNGNTTNIINSWNAGRYLVIHRDHGWPGGWANPGFSQSNIPSLTNGNLLPFVYSVNCASGLFDNETAGGDYGTTVSGTYFGEDLLRKTNGGAVAMLGDTRNSPSWPNSRLLEGFIDATYPNSLPSFGTSTKKRRLGDILNHGKLYMVSQIGVAGSGVDSSSSNSELFLWHAFGDPTIELWLNKPLLVVNPWLTGALISTRLVSLTHDTDGTQMTISQMNPRTQEMEAIGRGVVQNGKVDIQTIREVDMQLPVNVSACGPDQICSELNPLNTRTTDVPR